MTSTTATPAPGLRLDDVQGNILKGHGRKYTALVFFRFAGRKEAARENRRLLRDAASGTRREIALTSAARQQWQRDQFFAAPACEVPFVSLALSRLALQACDFSGDELQIGAGLDSDQFWDELTPEILNETGPWDPAFALQPDGVFLLAHSDRAACLQLAAEVAGLLRTDYGVGAIEQELGFRWTPKADQPGKDTATYEHFGFADGFARTALVATPGSPLAHLVYPNVGFIKHRVRPFEIPIGQVMIEQPGSFHGGSFLVISKLEQNVRAFLEAEAVLERRRHLLPEGMLPEGEDGRAGALFIGRTRNGVPLVRGKKHRTNRFHFGGDPEAKGCPFHAHIRKMNPRQNKVRGDDVHPQAGHEQQKASQFIRRGVLYGDENRVSLAWPDPAAAPDRDVGLLFMGYMAMTGDQFLKMYINWGPGSRFPRGDSAPDPLLGGGGKEWKWKHHPELDDPAQPLTLGHFVTNKGTGFFVVPPLWWMRRIP